MSTALPPSFPPRWQRFFKTPFRELLAEGPTGSLDWRVTLANADAPEPIATVIRNVVRRSGLWSNEKQAVADELLAHFNDGLEAGATPAELVESFGDPAVAGRLIRRAQRRRRPMVWQAWWLFTRTALAACLAYLVYGAYLLTQRPNPSVDYLAALNSTAAATPADATAWPLYERALKSLKSKSEAHAAAYSETDVQGLTHTFDPFWGIAHEDWSAWAYESHGGLSKSYSGLSESVTKVADDWLDGNQEELALFREAARHERFGVQVRPLRELPESFRELFRLGEPKPADDEPELLISTLLPHVQVAREVGQALSVELTRAADQGDGELAAADLRAILGVARHAGECRCLVARQVELAIRRLAIGDVEEVLRDHPDLWLKEQLLQIAHRLARPPRPLSYYYEGELAMQLDFIQNVYSARGGVTLSGLRLLGHWENDTSSLGWFSGRGDGTTLAPLGQWLALPGFALALPDRAATERAIHQVHMANLHDAELQLWELKRSRMLDEALQAEWSNNPVVAMLSPASKWIRTVQARHEGRRHGALIGIALQLKHRESGQWPESLDELEPRYLPELPVDPINGGPLGYRLVEGRPVVYSLGIDGDDDRGRQPADMDKARWEAANTNFLQAYPVAAPLDEPERSEKLLAKPERYDGDWVLWSLAEPLYMADPRAGSK